MVSRVGMLLWAWIILDSGACSAALPEITDRKFIDDCVREHNAARSAVSPTSSDMMYMSWDEGLAISARAWARYCIFDHNPRLNNDDPRIMHPTFPSVGENIWVGYPPSVFDVTGAIKNWVDEKKDYDYQRNSCPRNKMCGHYTQVVWAKSYKVGCAAVLCPGGIAHFKPREGVVFVCNYATAGNIVGSHPYQSTGAAACSGCTGTCKDRLCRDKERDSEKSNYWVPDWDPAAQPPPGSNYVSILIVRPVALIFSFITAYVVHHYYPDVFCYE